MYVHMLVDVQRKQEDKMYRRIEGKEETDKHREKERESGSKPDRCQAIQYKLFNQFIVSLLHLPY